MTRIQEIWTILDSQPGLAAGLEKIRYSQDSKPDIYLGIRHPDAERLLLFRISAANAGFSDDRQFRGIRLEKVYDTQYSDKVFFCLILTNRMYKEIFDAIIRDIIDAITIEASEAGILQLFLERLSKWETIFNRYESDELSPEEQRGLYGELYFLRKILQKAAEFSVVIGSWVGPDKSIRDFQYSAWAVEVKTTFGNNHQKIQISSERQLDTSHAEYLFLYHLSLEITQQAGETLNALTDAIRVILSGDAFNLDKFENKLLQSGYFDRHRLKYEENGYWVRKEAFYSVEGMFPRVEEKDIRAGVGELSYSIILSPFSDYMRTEDEVFSKIIFL